MISYSTNNCCRLQYPVRLGKGEKLVCIIGFGARDGKSFWLLTSILILLKINPVFLELKKSIVSIYLYIFLGIIFIVDREAILFVFLSK